MNVTADISYYPLSDDYNETIKDFLSNLNKYDDIHVEIGAMGTLIAGKHSRVINIVSELTNSAFESGNAVFTIKISNSCEL